MSVSLFFQFEREGDGGREGGSTSRRGGGRGHPNAAVCGVRSLKRPTPGFDSGPGLEVGRPNPTPGSTLSAESAETASASTPPPTHALSFLKKKKKRQTDSRTHMEMWTT